MTASNRPLANDLSFGASRRNLLAGSAALAVGSLAAGAAMAAGNSPAGASAPAHGGKRGSRSVDTITASDGTRLYYKDWRKGPAVVFSHGWPLNSDSWESQMLFLSSRGYRTVAHDRRGHSRSSQPCDGNDVDHYAVDLAT